MKILAVIPARAGSKGIPNKNIRIVSGRPLVYYSIKNALSSRYISKVIVTTDSEEVRIIARQMGADYKKRDAALCEDEVTLDSVVADAVPSDEAWDYIVTMQPTSPALSVETLDRAIEYCIENGLDTVISAINRPHLSWREGEGGRKVPNYKERLNRQYLPSCYVETGAFVISKANVVTKTSRIGESVDLFALSEEEAQDVDTFSDLLNAAVALEKRDVAIYVNGNNKRGMGHIYRALEIADEFFCKPDIYYDVNQTDRYVFGETAHHLIPVNGIHELFQRCSKKRYKLFINDILSTSIDYMIGLRTTLPDAKIVNFEDNGEGSYAADLVINALLGQSAAGHIYSGEKYYIPSKAFMFYEPVKIRKKVRRVFISFGGADPKDYSDRILKMASQEKYKDLRFVVVLGRAKRNVSELLEYNQCRNIEVLHDVGNMPELMSSCDIGVTSRGRTGFELAMLGIPTIAMAENAREELHSFVSNENGFSYIGYDPTDEVIEKMLDLHIHMGQESRQRYHEMLISHDLRNGRKRVMNLIDNL